MYKYPVTFLSIILCFLTFPFSLRDPQTIHVFASSQGAKLWTVQQGAWETAKTWTVRGTPRTGLRNTDMQFFTVSDFRNMLVETKLIK